ncbi:MAG: hypothetical protein NUW37_07915 [Planctomycetes bacterium]|nr:hypothetical protein [Planctomycetota bacterium]
MTTENSTPLAIEVAAEERQNERIKRFAGYGATFFLLLEITLRPLVGQTDAEIPVNLLLNMLLFASLAMHCTLWLMDPIRLGVSNVLKALLASLGICVLLSPIMGATSSESGGWWIALESFATSIDFASHVALFFLVMVRARERGFRLTLPALLIAPAAANAVYGIGQTTTLLPKHLEQFSETWESRGQIEMIDRVGSGNAFGTFVMPNAFAGFIALTMLLVIGRILSQIRETSRLKYGFVLVSVCALGLMVERANVFLWLLIPLVFGAAIASLFFKKGSASMLSDGARSLLVSSLLLAVLFFALRATSSVAANVCFIPAAYLLLALSSAKVRGLVSKNKVGIAIATLVLLSGYVWVVSYESKDPWHRSENLKNAWFFNYDALERDRSNYFEGSSHPWSKAASRGDSPHNVEEGELSLTAYSNYLTGIAHSWFIRLSYLKTTFRVLMLDESRFEVQPPGIDLTPSGAMRLRCALFGVGLEGFSDYYFFFRTKDSASVENAHQGYFHILAELGITGLLAFLGLIFFAIWKLRFDDAPASAMSLQDQYLAMDEPSKKKTNAAVVLSAVVASLIVFLYFSTSVFGAITSGSESALIYSLALIAAVIVLGSMLLDVYSSDVFPEENVIQASFVAGAAVLLLHAFFDVDLQVNTDRHHLMLLLAFALGSSLSRSGATSGEPTPRGKRFLYAGLVSAFALAITSGYLFVHSSIAVEQLEINESAPLGLEDAPEYSFEGKAAKFETVRSKLPGFLSFSRMTMEGAELYLERAERMQLMQGLDPRDVAKTYARAIELLSIVREQRPLFSPALKQLIDAKHRHFIFYNWADSQNPTLEMEVTTKTIEFQRDEIIPLVYQLHYLEPNVPGYNVFAAIMTSNFGGIHGRLGDDRQFEKWFREAREFVNLAVTFDKYAYEKGAHLTEDELGFIDYFVRAFALCESHNFVFARINWQDLRHTD